jgi:hypothetical protein
VKTIRKALVFGLFGLVVFGLLLFVPASTFNYWQAWAFLVVVLSTWIPSIYLLRADPAALQRRLRGAGGGNPNGTEGRYCGLVLVASKMFVVSALDHRFGWSPVPTAICLVGDVLVAN